MTFDEIVSSTMSRLNLTSTDAQTRIGLRVNERYKRLTTSLGLITSRRATEALVLDPMAIDSILPEFLVDDMIKITRITMTDSGGGIRTLKELTYDDITSRASVDADARAWAVKLMGASSVTGVLDVTPTTTFTLNIEGYEDGTTLSDTDEPVFPADFHDLLVEAVMSDELRKMEKPQLASIAEQTYLTMLSDLRMFIAKSAYQDIAQGRNKPSQLWYRTGFTRTSIWE